MARKQKTDRFTDADLDHLKRNIAITELCRSRGIELKKHGRKDLVGTCPFHDEDKPSFIVTPDKNLFHCLGCEAAGSVIDLLMQLDGLTFREAVDHLMTSTGLIKRTLDIAAKEKKLSPERSVQLLERVITLYEQAFLDDDEGVKFLKSRNLEDKEMFTNHRIGYASGTLRTILPKSGPVLDELKTLGILSKAGQEHFTGCVIFPVFDVEGRIMTLYGRHIAEGGRRHIFLPNHPKGLWNASIMKTWPELFVVESIIDALSVESAGFPNVVALNGSSGLSEDTLDTMCQHGVEQVTIVLDADRAGKQAADKIEQQVRSHQASFAVDLRCLPEGHDPNSFLQAFGREELANFLHGKQESDPERVMRAGPKKDEQDRSPVAVQHMDKDGSFAVCCGVRNYRLLGLDKSPRKLKVTLRVEHAGKLHVDTLDLYSSRSRKILASDLCRLFDEAADTIETDIATLIKRCENTMLSKDSEAVVPVVMKARDKSKAESFGRRKDLMDVILSDFGKCGLVGEESNKLLSYLAAVSRKMDEPLSLLVLSSSGAGKTALQDTTLAFVPPEDLVKLTSLSGKALFYKERLALKHKVLALEEGDGAQEATYAIRNLISAGELIIESTIKDLATGRLTTMENRVEGPTSVFITTTDPETDPETRSRFFVTSIDESREQTRRILDFQRQRHTLDGVQGKLEMDHLLQRHQNFQRLLKPLAVVNPFADRLTYEDDRLQGRRDHPKYLNLIKAVAFLHQMQRDIKTAQHVNGASFEYIEVTPEDIRIANKLAHEILGHSLGELSRPSRALLMELEKMITSRTPDNADPKQLHRVAFTRREIRQFSGWSNYRVHTHLKELITYEYVSMETDRNTNSHRYRLLYDGQGKDGERFMLGLSDPS